MRNGVREFVFAEPRGEGALNEVIPCSSCMARWIVGGANAHDVATGLGPAPPARAFGSHDDFGVSAGRVEGFGDLLKVLRLSTAAAKALLDSLEGLGAVSVSELTLSDWQSLQAWDLFLPLQQRRLSKRPGVC